MQFRYSANSINECVEFHARLTMMAQFEEKYESKKNLFAFKYFKLQNGLEQKMKGWQQYNIDAEFNRQGVLLLTVPKNDQPASVKELEDKYLYRYVNNE